MCVDIGSKIIQRRMELNLTQLLLARRAGIAQSTLSNIENSKKRPHFNTMNTICRVLDIIILDLLTCDEPASGSQILKESTNIEKNHTAKSLSSEKALRIQEFQKYIFDMIITRRDNVANGP